MQDRTQDLENALICLREETHRKLDYISGLVGFFSVCLMLMNTVTFAVIMLRPISVCPAPQSEVAK